jgi:signal peptidase I
MFNRNNPKVNSEEFDILKKDVEGLKGDINEFKLEIREVIKRIEGTNEALDKRIGQTTTLMLFFNGSAMLALIVFLLKQ